MDYPLVWISISLILINHFGPETLRGEIPHHSSTMSEQIDCFNMLLYWPETINSEKLNFVHTLAVLAGMSNIKGHLTCYARCSKSWTDLDLLLMWLISVNLLQMFCSISSLHRKQGTNLYKAPVTKVLFSRVPLGDITSLSFVNLYFV